MRPLHLGCSWILEKKEVVGYRGSQREWAPNQNSDLSNQLEAAAAATNQEDSDSKRNLSQVKIAETISSGKLSLFFSEGTSFAC